MKRILFTSEQIKKIVDHARAESPNECCGILAGENEHVKKIYPMRNTNKSEITYLMDPKEQFAAFKDMRRAGTNLIGIYHSHPASKAVPSKTDVKLAYYPDAAYIIISLAKEEPVIRAYNIIDNEIGEIELKELEE